MGLSDDINEAKKLWNGASLPMKGVIVLTLFLTTSSVTSLADRVFEWKGFILDGVEAYRELIAGNIITVLDRFGLQISVESVDVAIISGLLVAATIRMCFGKTSGTGPVPRLLSSMGERRANLAFVVFLVFGVLGAGIVGTVGPRFFGFVGGGVFLILYIALFAIMLDRSVFLNFAYPLLIATAFVLVLGAINVGLTRA